MAMSVTKPTQIRIRINDEDMPILEQLGGRVLTAPAVAAMLVSAAIEAIKANGGSVAFPPKFIVDTAPRLELQLNEKPAKARR